MFTRPLESSQICDKLKYSKIIALRQLLYATRTSGQSTLLYLGSHYKNPSSRLHVHSVRQHGISKLQSMFAETAAYFAVTVVVTCVARLRQTPTIYETTLIPPLIVFEVFLQTIHVFTSLSITPSNAQHPLPNDLKGGWSWTEEHRSIAFHTVYAVANAHLFILAQVIGYGNAELFQILGQCSPSLPAKQVLSSSMTLSKGQYELNFPLCSLIVWLVLCKTKLGARLGVVWESMSKEHTDGVSSTSHEPRRSNSVTANRLRIRDPFIAYGNSIRILYRNDKILLQSILILGAHLIIWRFWYLYFFCSAVAVPALHAILHSIFRHCMPKSYDRIVRQANDWEHWLETVAANLRLIEIPKLISATIFFWPMWDIVIVFGLVRGLRDNLHDKMSQADTQNEWSVGQVAAVIAWLPLCTQISALGFDLWRSQGRNTLP